MDLFMTKRKKSNRAPSRVARIRTALFADPIDIATIYQEANQRGLPEEVRADCWLALLEIDSQDVCFFFHLSNKKTYPLSS